MPGRNLSTNFNVSPYFDDYEADKKFLRILFRPGYPVQARELTQLQTIINEQIGRFGESIYEDGSIVTGLDFSLTDNTYIKLDNGTTWDTLKNLISAKSFGENYQINDEIVLVTNDNDRVLIRIGSGGNYTFALINQVIPSGFFGKILTQNFDVSTGAQGAQFEVNIKVTTDTDPASDSEDSREERPIFLVQGFTTLTSNDPPTIYGQYLTGTTFQDGDDIAIWDEDSQTSGLVISNVSGDFSGTMQLASVQQGVMFTNSFFVLVDQQTVPVEKYEAAPSARIGLSVNEDIVTPEEDLTLLDNAAGSPNDNAPGAHRFSISLNLEPREIIDEFSDIEDDSSISFYEISRVVDGEVVDRKEKPNYSVLGDAMAERLYDVNGNFTIKPFKITFEDRELFKLTVDNHSQGSEDIDVTASRTDIDSDDLIDKIFEHNEIPYRITNSISGLNDGEFTITLTSVPDFVLFETGTVFDIIDPDNFEIRFTPGSAYVNGRKFSTLGTTKKTLEKTRTADHTIIEENNFISASFGNYLVVNHNTSSALTTSDFNVGSIFDLYADDDGSDAAVGTARVKQLKNTINSKMELYLFDVRFDTISLTDVSGTSGTKTITSTNLEERHEGSTFVYNSTRYKIVSVDLVASPSEATLASELVDTLSSVDVDLRYNASTIKSIGTSDSETILTVADSVISDLNGDGYPETKLLEADKTRLIFNASDEVAEEITAVQYRYVRDESPITVNTDNTIALPLASTNEAVFADAANTEFFFQVINAAGSGKSVGDIIPPEEISTIETDGTVTLTNSDWNDAEIIASYPVIKSEAEPLQTKFVFGNTKTTTIASGSTTIDSANGQVRLPASVITRPNVFQTIGLTSAFRLREIIELNPSAGDPSIIDPSDSDFEHTVVTTNYEFDNGQRDDIVDHAYISLKPGYPVPTEDLLVIVDRITTTSSSTRTYYSVDSYSSLYYDYLPTVYTSDGEDFDLRSSIDFRPRANSLSSTTDFTTWDQSSKTFDQQVFLPHAENASLVQFDVEYYVSRIDKVSITPDLEFRIIKGIPSERPEAPNDIERSLTLYDIFQYPYSSDKNDIETTPYNHDRFTMKDINSLKERIVNIEKTIQLDKVQKAILSAEVTNESNTNLLKTGVLVDSFSNTDVADVSNTDFRASIDVEESQMRAAFDQYSLSVVFDSNDNQSTALRTPDGIIFPQYDDATPVTVVEQTLATRTENLNPFSIMNWLGEITLTPEKDFWKDIVRKPDVVTNVGGSNEAWKFLENNVPDRTEWNDWNTRWSGWKKKRSGRRRRGIFGRLGIGRKRNFSTYEASLYQEKTGVKTSFDTQMKTESLGDQVVDQSVIPYMRSVPDGIRFFGKSLKPNTLLYAWFDDREVIDYIRPGVVYVLNKDDHWTLYNDAEIGSGTYSIDTSDTASAESVTLTGKSSDSKFVYFHLTPSDRDSDIYGSISTDDTVVLNGTDVTGEIQKVIDQNVGDAFRLKSDPVGAVSGIFDVPSGTFKTGTRTFKLTDSSTNTDGSSDTNAERDFEASGMKSIVQENIVSTRVPVLKKKSVRQSRTIASVRGTVYSNSPTIKRWKDPIAQSFRVDDNTYPSGMYLHSVDLWFTSVDTSLPVTIRILPMANGYPDTQTVLPFGEVTLNASEVVSTSTPATNNYTRFTFSTPVFLQPGEYAVALVTNSLNYEVYSAVMGERILSSTNGIATDRVMNKQPFSGVLFKSQNASTWVPAIEEDIMFRLNRVSFQTGTFTARFDSVFDKDQIAALAPYKESSSDIHFTYDETGDTSKFTYNYYQLNVPQVADFENVIEPSYSVLLSDIDLTNGTVTQGTAFQNTVINDTKRVNSVKAVRENGNGEDFQVQVTFGTNNDVISPMIDEQQMNVIFIQNLIDEIELEVDSDITIVSAGTGYSVDDTFEVNDAVTNKQLGILAVDEIDPTTSGVTAVRFQVTPKLVTRNVVLNPIDVSGNGFDADIKSELDPFGGPAEAKYISKVVKLKSGFESRDIKVQLSAYRPKNTAIYVYYKVKSSEDSDVLQNKNWSLMYELSNPNEYSIEESDYIPLEFVTYNQRSDGTIDSTTRGGITYESGGTVFDAFNSYRIKVVLVSDTTNRTPVLQNLGGIALIDPIAP